ncbi:MAG: hypothetical protein CM1200mP2_35470 [Planctomycetaceae bacterium]|nr:MAG: hypothetical protein CM1200mP2_35470 [Planctomycetaceae bacterium]
MALQELVTRGQVRVSHRKRTTDDPVEISGDRVRIFKTKGGRLRCDDQRESGPRCPG